MIVLDTCALLWWTLSPESLSDKARILCRKEEDQGGLLVSSISVWEIGVKLKNKKLDIGMSIDRYTSLLEKIEALHFVPPSNDIWLKSLALSWNHKDPVDRVIVATAAVQNVQLVTKDAEIRKFYKKSIW